MKIWAKVMNGDKIVKDVVFERDFALTSANFVKALQDISSTLDLSTPVTLPTHFKHFEKFNRVKYIPRDFVEEVDFTSFVLERVVEKKKPENYYYM